MIRLKTKVSSAAALQGYARIESVITQILFALFDESCTVRYQASPRAFEQGISWLICRHESGVEFAFSISTASEPPPRAEYFSQLVKLARFFSTSPSGAFVIVSKWSSVPLRQHGFEVLTKNDMRANIMLASCSEELLSALLSEFAIEEVTGNYPKCHFRLEMRLGKEQLRNSFQVRADVNLISAARQRVYNVRLSQANGRAQIFIEQKDEIMNDTAMYDKAAEYGAVTLSLGALELSLDDILQLRPGMCIEFDMPEIFDGMLLVQGTPWRRAQVTLENRILKIIVQDEFVEQQSEKNMNISENEATSEQKLRLVG